MTKQQGAYVAVGLAVFLIGYGVYSHNKGASTPGCTLGTAGVAALVSHARGAESGEALLVSAGLGAACLAMADRIVTEPSKKVEITVTTPDGSEQRSTTGYDLTSQASTSSSTPDCFKYALKSAFEYQLCKDGLLK